MRLTTILVLGGEKEEAHHCLAAERPLDQGVHDEDDRDDGEEDAVDVDVGQSGRRVTDPLLALSLPEWISLLSGRVGVMNFVIAFIPAHSFGKAMRLDDRETEYVPDDAQCESAPLTSLKKHLTKSSVKLASCNTLGA